MSAIINNPTPEIAKLMPAECHRCGTWTQLGKLRLCHMCHNARYDALEELLEVVGMYRNHMPAEVLEALDADVFKSVKSNSEESPNEPT